MSMGILQTSATPVMSVRKLDRKSTRLNSSHTVISYAVFCLKKQQHTYELQSHSDLVCRLLLEITNLVGDEGRHSADGREALPVDHVPLVAFPVPIPAAQRFV